MSQHQIEKIANHQVVLNTSQNSMSSVNFNASLKTDKMSSEIIPSITTESATTAAVTDHNTSVYIMAGAAAGIMEHCLMYPVDSIKVVIISL